MYNVWLVYSEILQPNAKNLYIVSGRETCVRLNYVFFFEIYILLDIGREGEQYSRYMYNIDWNNV